MFAFETSLIARNIFGVHVCVMVALVEDFESHLSHLITFNENLLVFIKYKAVSGPSNPYERVYNVLYEYT